MFVVVVGLYTNELSDHYYSLAELGVICIENNVKYSKKKMIKHAVLCIINFFLQVAKKYTNI